MGSSRQEHRSGLAFPDTRHTEAAMLCAVILALLLLLLSRFSRVRLCVTPETAAHQAPPPLGLSRQGHWGGLPVPSAGTLPDPGTGPASPVPPELQVDSSLREW